MANNKRRIIVAYKVLPGEPDNCVVVTTENLEAGDHDALIKLVESPAGQEADDLATVMMRTQLSDGSNMLARFHTTGKLQRVKMSAVDMTPNTTTKIGLDELNKIIAQQRGVAISDLALKDPNSRKPGESITEAGSVSEMAPPSDTVVAESQVANIQAPTDGVLSDADLAAKYRSDADRLYKEAKALRAQAEELVPTVKKNKSVKETS